MLATAANSGDGLLLLVSLAALLAAVVTNVQAREQAGGWPVVTRFIFLDWFFKTSSRRISCLPDLGKSSTTAQIISGWLNTLYVCYTKESVLMTVSPAQKLYKNRWKRLRNLYANKRQTMCTVNTRYYRETLQWGRFPREQFADAIHASLWRFWRKQIDVMHGFALK